MATFNKVDSFQTQVGLGAMNLNTDTLKVYLTNVAPTSATTVFGTPAEIAAGNGYTATGEDVQNGFGANGAVGELTGIDVVWTAAGGTIGPFRYVVLYDDTTATKHVIGYWDYGSAVTLNDTETFTTDFGATILTIT